MTTSTVGHAPDSDTSRGPLVVIPALNEVQIIGEVVEEVIRLTGLAVLVIDDASSDATGPAARAAGADVIRLPVRQGAWGAIQTGLRYALGSGYSYIITMDADGQHDAGSIVRLLEPVRSGNANVSVGLCLERGTRLRQFAWKVLRSLSAVNIQDLTSGFRVYDRSAAKILTSPSASLLTYQDIGVLILLRNQNKRISEVTVPMYQRRSGASRIYHSWSAVSMYLTQTLLLCVSKISLSWKPTHHSLADSGD